jgi:hypothetical protein
MTKLQDGQQERYLGPGGYPLTVTRTHSLAGASRRMLLLRSCSPPRTITVTGSSARAARTMASSRAWTFTDSSRTFPSGVTGLAAANGHRTLAAFLPERYLESFRLPTLRILWFGSGRLPLHKLVDLLERLGIAGFQRPARGGGGGGVGPVGGRGVHRPLARPPPAPRGASGDARGVTARTRGYGGTLASPTLRGQACLPLDANDRSRSFF